MSFRSNLWISAVAAGALIVPASAQNFEPEVQSTTPPTLTRTYMFPATGLAPTETARIAVVNIAPTSSKGTKASCTGSIQFHDATGAVIPAATTAFTNIGTGQIAKGDLPGIPSGPVRAEVQGSVQLTVTPSAAAPCSLLITLEIFDTNTGVTHAVVTSATEQPLGLEFALGHSH